MEKNLKKSYKIICLDQNTKNELIEKFNIVESKINIIDGFFPEVIDNKSNEESEDIYININAKYGINKDYFIYSGGDSIEKNYEKLINVFERIQKTGKEIDLVFLGENVSKNINLRNIVLEHKMEKSCFFLGSLPLNEKELIYKNSMGTIFPSFYEPFPFRLTEPINFGTQILSSDLKNIRSIFNDKIEYFSPISINNIFEKVKNFIENSKENKKINYDEIIKKYTVENTTKQLIEVIK